MTQTTNTKTQSTDCIAGERCEFDACMELAFRPPLDDAPILMDNLLPAYVPEITAHDPRPDTSNDWIGVEVDLQRLMKQCAQKGEFDGALRIASFLEPTELTINLLFNELPHDAKLFEFIQKMIDSQESPILRNRLMSVKEAYFGKIARIERLSQRVATDAGTMVADGEFILLTT